MICSGRARAIPIEVDFCDFTELPFGAQIAPHNGDATVSQVPEIATVS
jgi:hypothetical protein